MAEQDDDDVITVVDAAKPLTVGPRAERLSVSTARFAMIAPAPIDHGAA